MASLKYLDPITGEYKKVSSSGGGTSIPASDTEPATGNYWLDTSAEGGTYYTAAQTDALIAANIGIRMKLLWENASPSSDFAAQTIALDLSDYSIVVIKSDYWSGDSFIEDRTPQYDFAIKGSSIIVHGYYGSPGYRVFSVNDTGVVVDSGRKPTETVQDAYYVPLAIYGIKGVNIV